MGGAAGLTSLVTKEKDNAHKLKRKSCPEKIIFQEVNGHGCWRFSGRPCDRWTCEPCYQWRLETELVPEITEGLEWAKETGETLKFYTLTYRASDLAAAQDFEGKKRRRLDLAHYAQLLRRKGYRFEYLKVVEAHKSGKIHMHLLVMAPFIPQKFLSEAWSRCTRGTSRVVHVEAAFMKCPRCYPGKHATAQEKKRSHIVPPPGRGECLSCGFRPGSGDYYAAGMDAAKEIAWEVAKYLSKELAGRQDKSRVKKLTRSKGWKERCVRKDQAEPLGICDHCGVKHIRHFVGKLPTLVKEGFGVLEDIGRDYKVAYYPRGKGPSLCWGEDIVWLESKVDGWGHGLVDQVGPSLAELLE